MRGRWVGVVGFSVIACALFKHTQKRNSPREVKGGTFYPSKCKSGLVNIGLLVVFPLEAFGRTQDYLALK